MEDYKRIIANNITELRKAVPLTQAELAERLNYSDKAVSKWERGESIPDVIVLKQIADIFGVSVDYLLEEVHPLKATMQNVPRQLKQNRLLITGVSCVLVFLIATLVFVILASVTELSRLWLAYVYCVPVCSILLIVFNSVWGKAKLNFFFISLLVWSILASIYLSIGSYEQWLIFTIGIPAQVIIIMWSGIKARFFVKRNKKKKEKNEKKEASH
ncbi:MAG: helix-turn-helix transcriptional regulator [Clostridia bacterium]|nr:helix-turn-helix transcriptional regulator [Clostridia bacterium]